MTLLELANFICSTVSQTEAEDVLAAKGYLKQRHKMLWQDQLWKDSVVEFTQTITSVGYTVTSTWLPTKQILLLPPLIGQVIALRTGNRKLDVQSSEFYYGRDFDTFANQGVAVDYRLLSPCVWEWDTSQEQTPSILVAAADVGLAYSADLVATDGYTVSRQADTMTAIAQALSEAIRIDALSKTASDSDVSLQIRSATLTNATSNTRVFTFSPTFDHSPRTNAVTLAPGATAAITPDVYVWADDGPSQVVAITNGVGFNGTISFDGVTGTFGYTFTSTDPSSLVTIAAENFAAAKRQRLQILGSIDDNTVLRVLGKRTCPTFEDDNDEVGITGADNCLIAFALADLYRRERQVGKAQAVVQTEAVPLLAQLVKEQTMQQAHHKRVIPEDGFGAGPIAGGQEGLWV